MRPCECRYPRYPPYDDSNGKLRRHWRGRLLAHASKFAAQRRVTGELTGPPSAELVLPLPARCGANITRIWGLNVTCQCTSNCSVESYSRQEAMTSLWNRRACTPAKGWCCESSHAYSHLRLPTVPHFLGQTTAKKIRKQEKKILTKNKN